LEWESKKAGEKGAAAVSGAAGRTKKPRRKEFMRYVDICILRSGLPCHHFFISATGKPDPKLCSNCQIAYIAKNKEAGGC